MNLLKNKKEKRLLWVDMIYQVEKGQDPIISGNSVGHETIDISQMRNTLFVCHRRIYSKLTPQNELNDNKPQCKTTLALSIKTALVTFCHTQFIKVQIWFN